MLHVTKLLPQGQGLAAVLLKRAASVELDWHTRQKPLFECTDSQGRQLAVSLPAGSVVRGGDVLVAEDGSMVRVVAAPQPVMIVQHVGDRGTVFDLVRAAYHLGQRHVPLELKADHFKFAPDPAIADLLRALHLVVIEAQAPFDPEAGAAAAHGAHAHHDHDHDDGPDHDHGHGHRHGPGCGHDH